MTSITFGSEGGSPAGSAANAAGRDQVEGSREGTDAAAPCGNRAGESPLRHIVEELRKRRNATLVYDRAGVLRELELLTSHLKTAAGPRLSYGVRFSIKANSNEELLRWLSAQGVGAEVSSMAEFEKARAAGMEFISATSPGFSAADVRRLFEHGVEVNIDNLSQLDGAPEGSEVGLRLRMPLDLTAEGDGNARSRFGVDVDSPALHEKLRARGCEVVRVHCHFRDVGCARQLESLARRLVTATKIWPRVTTINLGGGMTRLYKDPAAAGEAWRRCAPVFEELPAGARVLVEPGAQLLTGHGYLGMRVLSVTPLSGGEQLVVVDTSKWNLVCWSEYGLVSPEGAAGGVVTSVVGPTCYEKDVWVAGTRLPALTPGEQLIFRGLGAYVSSMARKMHGLQLPEEVMV
jgi:diaminopimelate decarboxylase